MKLLKFRPQLAVRLPLLPFKPSYTIQEMEELLYIPKVAEAIYIASPDLFDQYQEFKKGKVEDNKRIVKMWVSLHNYFTRMSSRATPFGLFAGMSIGTWSSEQLMQLRVSESRNIHARFDMDFVTDLIEKLEEFPEVRKNQRYSLNPSLYRVGDKYSYIEYSYVDDKRIYQMSQITADEYIHALLEAASDEVSYDALCKTLLSLDSELELPEVEDFLDELINSQLLFGEMRPSLTGEGPWENMVKTLARIGVEHGQDSLLAKVEELNTAIASVNEYAGTGPAVLREIVNRGRKVIPDIKSNHLIQVDSFLDDSKFTVDDKIKDQLDEVFGVLRHFAEPTENYHLKVFRHEFIKRYGPGKQPLLQVLDPNQGIGYPYEDQHSNFAPFLATMKTWDNAQFGVGNAAPTQAIQWNKKQEFLMHLVLKAQKENALEVNVADLNYPWDTTAKGPMPDSFHVLFSVFGKDEKADEYKLELTSVGGSSGTNLVARFGSSHIPTKEVLTDLAQLEEEKRPDGVVAEIVHLSQDRLGNVVLRPDMRSYEIPFLAKPGVSKEHQILLSDLMIEVTEDAQEVILWSEKLKQRVYTKLSNAHNYSRSDQPPYRFLCELQSQGVQMVVNFNWGSIGQMFKFFPRVAYKNVVLCRASWNLQYMDYKDLIKNESDEKIWNEWCDRWNIPSVFLYVEQDNELLIDTKNEWARQSLISRLKKKSSIRITEFLFDKSTVPSRNLQDEPFANQFIAFVEEKSSTQRKVQTMPNKVMNTHATNLPSTFMVGSEWLYYKIYCSPTQADTILTEACHPLVKQLEELCLIDKWFFIRYYDPDFHLRIRFHVPQVANLGQVMPLVEQLLKPLVGNHQIKSVLLDTYEREMSRYGGDLIIHSEAVFHGDSLHHLGLFRQISASGEENLRWKYAIWTIDQYLDLLRDGDLEEKLAFTGKNCDYFGREFGMNKHLKRQFDTRYRELTKDIEQLLGSKGGNVHFSFDEVSGRISRELLDVFQSTPDSDTIHPHSLMSSLIHMSMNRLWPVSGRFHEFCMYYLLNKYYKSSLARRKYSKVS